MDAACNDLRPATSFWTPCPPRPSAPTRPPSRTAFRQHAPRRHRGDASRSTWITSLRREGPGCAARPSPWPSTDVTDQIYSEPAPPRQDFCAPTLRGYSDNLPPLRVLTCNPDKAKELWAPEASTIAPWDAFIRSPTTPTAATRNGGRAASPIKNTLNISAGGKRGRRLQDHAPAGGREDHRRGRSRFQAGDRLPSIYNFLQPQRVTGSLSRALLLGFDSLITRARCPTEDDGIAIMQQARNSSLKDLRVVPLAGMLLVPHQRQRRMEQQRSTM